MRLGKLFAFVLAMAACSAAGGAPVSAEGLQAQVARDIRAWPGSYPVQLQSVGVDTTHAAMMLPQASGWIGSDVAHSIPLDAGRILWLYGDTLVGSVSAGKRNGGAAFINNSVGIQALTVNPPGYMTYYWGPGTTAFFPHQAGTPGSYYWPSNGLMIGGKAFIFCFSITGSPSGFSTAGTTLIRVENPQDPIASWTYTYSDFGIGGDHIGFMTGLIVEGAYLYMMGFEDQTPGGRVAVLGRIATADLLAGANASSMQFWVNGAGGPQWGASPANLVPLFSPGVTESAIQYVPEWGRYFTTTYEVFGPRILLTTATSLTGPWSAPVELYSVPDWSAYTFDIVAYAARVHPEFSTVPGELVLSYATNTWGTLAPLFTVPGLNIYYPRFVNARLSLTGSGVGDWTLY